MALRAIANVSDQMTFNGVGPLDSKLAPVATVDDLPSPFKSYMGMTVTVISDDDGKTSDYQFTPRGWEKKIIEVNGGEF